MKCYEVTTCAGVVHKVLADVVHADRHNQLKLLREAPSKVKADRDLVAMFPASAVLSCVEVPNA